MNFKVSNQFLHKIRFLLCYTHTHGVRIYLLWLVGKFKTCVSINFDKDVHFVHDLYLVRFDNILINFHGMECVCAMYAYKGDKKNVINSPCVYIPQDMSLKYNQLFNCCQFYYCGIINWNSVKREAKKIRRRNNRKALCTRPTSFEIIKQKTTLYLKLLY